MLLREISGDSAGGNVGSNVRQMTPFRGKAASSPTSPAALRGSG